MKFILVVRILILNVFFIKDLIDKYKSIESYILELFNNDVIDSKTNDELKLFWNGFYYQRN
jgi:hypothetical protein